MTIEYIEHYLVQTEDFEGTVHWYEDVLNMRRGATPNFGFPVQWMYVGDKDVRHITQGGKKTTENRKLYLGQQSELTQGSGVIDHIGFRCSGLAETIASLVEKKVEFRQRQVNNQGLYQLFLFDPNGVKVELNFPLEEAAGFQPEVTAAGFSYQNGPG